MELKDFDLKKLLPQFMRNDPFFVSLSNSVNDIIKDCAKNIDLIFTIGKVDELPEAVLDEIAWENNLFWYYKDDSIDIKRINIKSYKKILQSLGTPWAIKKVIEDIYGSAKFIEWFDEPESYNPHEFAIFIPDQENFTQENRKRLLNRVLNVKRASQRLKSIYTVDDVEVDFYVGAFYRQNLMSVCEKPAKGFIKDEKIENQLYVQALGLNDNCNFSLDITE